MNYLVSYQHSGNTKVRYFIELLTGFPTVGYNISCIADRFKNNKLKLVVDRLKEPLLVKRHDFNKDEITIDDKLIFILREDESCIKENYETEILKFNYLKDQYLSFKGKKMVIFYHEIVNNILDVCFRILNFIEFKNKIKSFGGSVEYHEELSLSVYRNPTGQPGAKRPTSEHDDGRDYPGEKLRNLLSPIFNYFEIMKQKDVHLSESFIKKQEDQCRNTLPDIKYWLSKIE